MVSPEPAIEVAHISKTFQLAHAAPTDLKARVLGWLGGRRLSFEPLAALDDVSLSVAPGEMVGLVGANGSGKSTLLQIVAGIYTPDAGQVAVRGRLSALLELGAGFSRDLTGRDNVFLNGALLGVARAELVRRFNEIVAFAEVERFIDMPLSAWSSGMQMRLAFATAAHFDPDILVLDEILAVGDDAFQRKCLRRVQEIRSRGAAVLFVSHDLVSLEQLCDRAVLLEAGRLIADGPPATVISTYRARGAVSHGGERRWGSGEVRIAGVTLSRGKGPAQRLFRTGDPLTIAIDLETPQRVERPVVGLAVRQQDGMLVSGPNSKMAHADIAALEGRQRVTIEIPALTLLPGGYAIAVSVYDSTLVTAFDHWEGCSTLSVLEDGTDERFGVVSLGATWRLGPGGGDA